VFHGKVSEGASLLSAVELPSPSKFAAKHKAANPHLLSACVHFPQISIPSSLSYHKSISGDETTNVPVSTTTTYY
jgi:hypothetical protein